MASRSLRLALATTLLVCLAARVCGSAIPMWEFLTREEKMSHLYKIFSQEVAQFCADSTMPDCSKIQLITGLKNLANLDDDKLDEMDPYQRGAKDIIWRSIVGRQTGSRLGQHSFHANDDDPLAVGDNELPQESAAHKDYTAPSEHSGPYLTGPMVIRVYPDGRPVPKDAQRPLPKDEDIEEIRSNSRIPSLTDLESSRKASATGVVASLAEPEFRSFEPSSEMLPPRKMSARSTGPYPALYVPTGRYYPTRLLGRPNNLLIRESYY